MGVMVLHADRLEPFALERLARRQVVRVEVVCDQTRLDREHALEVLHPFAERVQRLPVLQVADVVADPGAAPLGDAEGALELGAAREQRRRLERELDARRHEAPGAPHQQRLEADPGVQRAQHASRRFGCGSGGRRPGARPRSPRGARERRRRGTRSARPRRCRMSSRASARCRRGAGDGAVSRQASPRGRASRARPRRRPPPRDDVARSRSVAPAPRGAPPRARSARPDPALRRGSRT